MIRSQTTGGKNTMNMGMKQQALIPCVQHTEEADLCSEMAGIG